MHLGSSGRLSVPAVDSPPDMMITLQPMNIQSAAADLLWSRVLKEYPALRVALSEGGTGWVPFAHVPKEEATVGALRQAAAGHDVSVIALSSRIRTADEKLEGFRRRARAPWLPRPDARASSRAAPEHGASPMDRSCLSQIEAVPGR